jgi:hypothetical protein
VPQTKLQTPSLPADKIKGWTPALRLPCDAAISHIGLSWTTIEVPHFKGRNELNRTPQKSSGASTPIQNGMPVMMEAKPEVKLYFGMDLAGG